MRSIKLGLGLLAALTLAACAKPDLRVSGEVVWARVDGGAFPVTAGDIVRIETTAPVSVTSVIGFAEVTETLTPKDGVVMFRPVLGTTMVKVAGGDALVVHDGGPRDPEIAWFDLEDEALDWADTPLGTPFPALSPAPRLDPQEAADLDAALKEANVSDPHGIRALFALRAIRKLEGARMYPYAANGDLKLNGPSRDIKGRDFFELKPGGDGTLKVDGPTILAVSSRIVRGATDVEAEVRVKEGPRLRGSVRSLVHHVMPEGETQKVADDEEKPDPTLSALRRIIISVPPGEHTYQVEAVGATAWVAPTSTKPYLRMSDYFGGSRSQSSLGEDARKSCNDCAIALALTGDDLDAKFDAALASATPLAKKVATNLSAGAPFDRATKLESDAASADATAIAQVGKDAANSIDASLREAWARGTLRGASWQTVDSLTGSGGPKTWFAAGGGAHEIGDAATTMTPSPWRRAQAIRLMATGPCGSEPPVQLEVNGQTLTAQPSAARATWHVVVPANVKEVKARRLDKGAAKVYALDEGGGSLIGAALPLAQPRSLAFPADATAPGVEVWLKQGATSPENVTLAGADGRKLAVVANPGPTAFAALAEDGTKWTRVATIPLPPGMGNVTATGSAKVAVRAVARAAKKTAANSEEPDKPIERALPPDVGAVIGVSKKLVNAKTPADRAAAALERGKLLASYGDERAAIEDAELAQAYGIKDAVLQVQDAFRPPPPKPQELATAAYGLEPDFDPNAARCVAGEGPRAKVAALDAQLRSRPKGAPYDRNLAIAAASLKAAAPEDPRSDSLVTLATNGSRWKLLREVEGGGGRVARPADAKERNALLDADGRLRPHVLAGDPFGQRYVAIASDRPARAAIAALGGSKSHLDVVCTPRRKPEGNEKCPLEVTLGGAQVPVNLNDEGIGTVDLPRARGRGKNAELVISLGNAKADYSALVRIVASTPIPGTTKEEGVGYVLDTPHVQYRFVLPPNKPIRVKTNQAGLLRVDADPEGNEKAEVFANVGGKEIPIPLGGDPQVLPVAAASTPVTITSRGGTATVAIAERVESEARTPELGTAEPAAAADNGPSDAHGARTSLNDGTWRETADKSPKPYGWWLDHLGTFEELTGVTISTLREGSTQNTDVDRYAFQHITYRRRIEDIDLYTMLDGLVRIRSGAPTYGASGTFYEDWNATRMRITGTVDAFFQSIDSSTQLTLQPRGFVEYSGRVSPSFYILPRIGYDGWFTSLAHAPKSLKDVDDDVYNAFRASRSNFVFLQALFWWVPFFDDIIYLRTRGTYDVGNNQFSHGGGRLGLLFITGPIEFDGYADAQYYRATPGARTSSGIDITGGATVLYHMPIKAGSFEVRPSIEVDVRDDSTYDLIGGVTVILSPHRGVRDYSSLELSFPESTAGGVPWRTNGREGP